MIQKLEEPKQMDLRIKNHLLRYFENLNEHTREQAFIMAMSNESDREYLRKQAEEFKQLYYFDPVENNEECDLE